MVCHSCESGNLTLTQMPDQFGYNKTIYIVTGRPFYRQPSLLIFLSLLGDTVQYPRGNPCMLQELPYNQTSFVITVLRNLYYCINYFKYK